MTFRPVLRLVGAWGLALALLLLGQPLVARLAAATTAVRFLVEFLTDGGRPWLSRSTPPPVREPLAARGLDGTLWRPGGRGRWPALVLVHGLTPAGASDPRLAAAAARLARAGFVVAAPDLSGLRGERLRPDDARPVGEAIRAVTARREVRPGPVSIVAVSVGLAPVALALRDPALEAQVRLVVALGGYAEARELIRFFTTGAYGFDGARGRAPVHVGLAEGFLAANLDLVHDPRDRTAVAEALAGRALPATAGPEAHAVLSVLENRDPARVDALLDALPPATRALLDALSPARQLRHTRVRLLAVHGRDDPVIPFTESLRLAAALPGRTRVVLVDLLAHVEGRLSTRQQLAEFARLWSVGYELFGG
ncbi:MAG TPA: hypothetical protein VFC42_07065 [Methylomirabilota bacterium]|jgi:fermentation-respiration switch protein FrsA (DUF1100 family)|nr:hypothetical protein [Methylomirabilota bacterium]